MHTERRQYPRAQSNLPIKIFDTVFDIVTETKDISGSGAYCSINENIEPMTKLKLTLLVPMKKGGKKLLHKVNCKGVVVRKEHIKVNGKYAYNIGIFFNEIKDSDRKAIVSYVNSGTS